MSEHFIKNIEIKNFKCFENFKAEGFGRVNLIGGKNNVGKTAFMEACYLSQAQSVEELFSNLLEIKTHRDIINMLLLHDKREKDLEVLIKNNLNIFIVSNKSDFVSISKGNGSIQIDLSSKEKRIHHADGLKIKQASNDFMEWMQYEYSFNKLKTDLDFYLESTKYKFSINFITPYSNSNEELENIIGQSKLDNKYDELNKYLYNVFGVASIDIIKNKPMLKINNEYRELSYFGQGIKTFINTISSILLLKNDIIFIDEIENGIHYTNLDKLWEIILTISKDQNVQVFATTHSKECIESYARVAKELKDKDINYSAITKLKSGKLIHSLYNYELLENAIIEQGHEVRGW